MAIQGLFTGGVKIRSLNGYLIAVNGEVFATTNTGGTTNAFFYRAKTTITSGDPGSGHLIWNNATQISATQLNVSHLTDNPVEDIDLFLSAIASGNKLVVQDRNDSANYQSWTVTGTPTQIGSTYWTIPVSLIESQGTGTTGFANNHDLLFAIISGGTGGGGITTNAVTFNNSGSGAASGTSFNGATPVTVSYNTFGAQQASASLTALAGLTYASGTPFVKMTGAGTFALDTNTYITGNQTITISGDASGSGATAITLTLANVNSNVGTFNNVTVNAKGLVTAASNVAYLTANQTITLSGDVTGSGATAITTTIANNAVTLAKMAQVATARFLGRVTAGTGNVEALTGTQATTLLDTFTSALKGLAPASGGGTTNFLRADGTWAAPPGGGTPAGSNTQIQYNNSGAFGASNKLTWNESTRVLNVGDGSADSAIEIYSRNVSNGWAGRFLGDYVTGQFYIQHRNNSATWQTCLFFNGNTSGQTYMVDKAYVVGLGILMVNTAVDNGVDKLQVNGSAIATRLKVNTSGQTLEINNYYNTGSGNNIWIGNGGASSTSGYNNVAIGGNALLSVTSGFLNTAVGASALQSLTSGSGNMAFGFESLPLLTTGTANTAIGPNALGSSTTGSDNTGIGNASLIFLTTTSSNVGIGRDAGRFISGGSILTTPTQSVFIGNDTRASANGNTNEIVIGHNAIGQGSNSVTLGNSSITQTLLRGTVTAGSYVKSGGTNSQVLYADGSTKQITSGTAAPTGGNDGDIYLQYDVSLLTGSGTANYIPKFTSATAIGNSQIFDNGTSVGIGTASPTTSLQVGNSSGLKQILISGGGYDLVLGASGGTFLGFASQAISLVFNTASVPLGVGTNAAQPLILGTSGLERMRITSAGDVGIGTTSPIGKLNISSASGDQIRIDRTSQTARGIVISGTDQFSFGTWTSPTQLNLTTGGNLLLNTTTDNGTDRLQVSGSALVTGAFQVATTSGNVSLRTTASTYAVNMTLGANAGIGFYQDGIQSVIIGQNQNLSTTNELSARGANLDLVGIGATYVRIITNSNERARIASSGRVLINTTSDNGTDQLQVNGSIQANGFDQAYTAQTTTYTATTSDYIIDCTTGTFTVNLFTAVGNTGRILIIKNSGTGTITVDPNGSQTIDGATTQTLSTQWSRVHIISDGANWKIISN